MGEPALRAEGLTRRFDTVTAVDHVDLVVEPGTVFGFLGPNGAGKTTMIRLALGLLEPSEGRVSVLGHDVAVEGDAVRRACGVLLEQAGLYERLSAFDNLEFYGRLWRMSDGDRRARIAEMLGHFGLADRQHEIVSTWSRGMKQKLALARALLHRPTMVFLDEPTAGLDPIAAASLRSDLLLLANREGVTVFVTTHNLDEAERMCDSVGLIRAGRLIAQGSPASLRARGGSPTVTVYGSQLAPAVDMLRARPEVARVDVADGHLEIELRGDAPMAPLVRVLVANGANIEEIHKGAPSLEEAFLALLERSEPDVA